MLKPSDWLYDNLITKERPYLKGKVVNLSLSRPGIALVAVNQGGKTKNIKIHYCIDCLKSACIYNIHYMVYPEVWKAAGLETKDGYLCIPSLESRLGRKLTIKDFDLNLSINSAIKLGYELGRQV